MMITRGRMMLKKKQGEENAKITDEFGSVGNKNA